MTEMLDVTRWNVQRDGDALLICEGDHERHEGCTFNRYIRADLVDELVKALGAQIRSHAMLCRAAGLTDQDHALGTSQARAALTRIKGDGK